MKSAIRSPILEIWAFVRFWLIKRPLRPLAVQDPSARIAWKLVSGSPSGHPPRQNNGSEREGGCRRSFGRHPENCFGKPGGPAPSARITERARATARVCHGCPPRLSPKLQPSPRKFSWEARRARPQRQNDGNELSGSPTGQTQAQTFDDSSRRWHATRPGRVSANPKP